MKRKKPAPAPGPTRPPKEKPFYRPFAAVIRPDPAAVEPPRDSSASTPAARAPARAAPKTEATDDQVRFADLLYGVTPIDRGPRAEPSLQPVPPPRAVSAADPDDAARVYLRELVQGGDARFELSDDGTRIEGRRLDLDLRALRRLRRGELTIDARCDLHGLGASEARGRVESFVAKSRARGERVLLIIHGRGAHSVGAPVLRGEMGAWLAHGAASAHVAAFATALPDDGGDGAVYVLLR